MRPRTFHRLAASPLLAWLRPRRGAERKRGGEDTLIMARPVSLGVFKSSRHFCGLGDDATGSAGVAHSAP